jgi:hypothetical protein
MTKNYCEHFTVMCSVPFQTDRQAQPSAASLELRYNNNNNLTAQCISVTDRR